MIKIYKPNDIHTKQTQNVIFIKLFLSLLLSYINSYKTIEDHQDQITRPILYGRLTFIIGQLGLVWLTTAKKHEIKLISRRLLIF